MTKKKSVKKKAAKKAQLYPLGDKPISTKKPAQKTPKEKPTQPEIEEPKPDFEKTLDEIAADQAKVDQEKKDGRGGVRPGAGRPRGATEEFAAVNRLPEKANLTLVPVLQIPFEIWAKGQDVPGLTLNKDDAKELALPVTQLLEFYFPGRIPEIAWVWLMMLGSSYNILKPRLELLTRLRKERTQSVTGGGKGPDASRPVPETAKNLTVADIEKNARPKD